MFSSILDCPLIRFPHPPTHMNSLWLTAVAARSVWTMGGEEVDYDYGSLEAVDLPVSSRVFYSRAAHRPASSILACSASSFWRSCFCPSREA